MTHVSHIEPLALAHPRVAIVVSRYNRRVTDALERGAIEAFERETGGAGQLDIIPAPGAFELPCLASAAASLGVYDAIVCLGCVIKGETSHDRHIATGVAGALALLAMEQGLPVAFGVLTVDTPEQAEARAGGPMGNKGTEAMRAALAGSGIINALEQAPVTNHGQSA